MAKKRQETVTEATSDWHAKALEMLPELSDSIAESDNPMYLWCEISHAFNLAYGEPRDEDLIRRIYSFADWCAEQEARDERAEHDLFTCVVIGFYQDIPMNKAARLDMPRWFSLQDVRLNKKVFSYHLTEAEYTDLLTLYNAVQPKYGTRRRTPQ